MAELDSKVRKPAEAEKIKMEIMAAATHRKILLEGAAAADAMAIKGEAEAFAVEAKGKAKAEEMAVKADAWKEYQKAAKVAMILEALPAITAEVAAPLSQVNKVTMVGYVDSDRKESLGPAKLTNEVLQIVSRIPDVVHQMTGHKVKLG